MNIIEEINILLKQTNIQGDIVGVYDSNGDVKNIN